MLTVGATVHGLNGRVYKLGPELGSGGEGTVYEMPGENIVIKIYKNPQPELERKLYYLVCHPVPSLVDQYNHPILKLAWPNDIVYGQEGFVGYVMPRLENALEIFHVVWGCQFPKAKKMWPDYTWMLNVQVARNLALSVSHLHRAGYVIGDMNDKNIMVESDGAVCILDIDSFDFTDMETGVHYRCGVGLADYLAPELQGRNLRTANFTTWSDDFALAIHIFQLLMDNFHPFTGRRLVQTQNSFPADQRIQRMVEGECPFVKEIPGYDIPAGAPKLNEVLPQKLCDDFVKTFCYDSASALEVASQRTSAEQWFEDLNNFYKVCEDEGLVQCSVDPKHYYLRSIGFCGRCAAQKRLQALQNQSQKVYLASKDAECGDSDDPEAPLETESPEVMLHRWTQILNVLSIAQIIVSGIAVIASLKLPFSEWDWGIAFFFFINIGLIVLMCYERKLALEVKKPSEKDRTSGLLCLLLSVVLLIVLLEAVSSEDPYLVVLGLGIAGIAFGLAQAGLESTTGYKRVYS